MTEQNPHKQSNRVWPDSDLFEPSLQIVGSSPRSNLREPWRVRSQFWIAFFGGSLALTAIAYLNGERLRLTRKQQRCVLLTGVVGLLLTLGAAYFLAEMTVGERWQPGPRGTGFRVVSRAIAVLVYSVIARFQRSGERIHRFRGGEYASLWGPGLLAVMVLGTLQNIASWVVAQ